jgi:hypothetical protein
MPVALKHRLKILLFSALLSAPGKCEHLSMVFADDTGTDRFRTIAMLTGKLSLGDNSDIRNNLCGSATETVCVARGGREQINAFIFQQHPDSIDAKRCSNGDFD